MSSILPALLRPSIASTSRTQWSCGGPLFGIVNSAGESLLLPHVQNSPLLRLFSISSKPFRRRLQGSQCNPAINILLHQNRPIPQPPTARSLATRRPPKLPRGHRPYPLPSSPTKKSSTPSSLPSFRAPSPETAAEYDPDLGLSFRSTPLSEAEIHTILSPSISPEQGNLILKVQHGRRIHGFLNVPDEEFECLQDVDPVVCVRALGWLRGNVPVDEEAAVRKREEDEGREWVERAERLGIYKKEGLEAGAEAVKERVSVYGESALDKWREEKERERERELKKKIMLERAKTLEKPASEVKAIGEAVKGTLGEKAAEPAWVEYYRKRAVLSEDTEPPKMSKFQRLFPGTLFAITALIACYIFAKTYNPPPSSFRVFPSIPPAAATILGIIACNTLVFVAWRIPPFWRALNKFFVCSPGYPLAASLLGNVFSHKDLQHLAMNMAVLYIVGTRLHDRIGRGDFLAIYLASGIFGSYVSLVSFVLRSNFTTASMGASGAIAGTIAAWCVVNATGKMKLIWIPEEWIPAFSSMHLLALLVGMDVLGLVAMSKPTGMDHFAHLGGYFCGYIGAMWAERRRKSKMTEAELERIKKLSLR